MTEVPAIPTKTGGSNLGGSGNRFLSDRDCLSPPRPKCPILVIQDQRHLVPPRPFHARSNAEGGSRAGTPLWWDRTVPRSPRPQVKPLPKAIPRHHTLGVDEWSRRMFAEFAGTGLLVTAVVGSGIMAVQLSPESVGLQLLANAAASALALGALILTFGPVSGAHFNPVVSLASWWLGRSAGTGLTRGQLGAYTLAQVAGGICGAVLANVMFDLAPVTWATTRRLAAHLWLGEVVATAGLILLIFALVRSRRDRAAPAAVAAYIGAASWFTSSASFANPAVTIGRAFTDTFTGIAPTSVPGYVAAQVVGAVVGVGMVFVLYPSAVPGASDAVVPHGAAGTTPVTGGRDL